MKYKYKPGDVISIAGGNVAWTLTKPAKTGDTILHADGREKRYIDGKLVRITRNTDDMGPCWHCKEGGWIEEHGTELVSRPVKESKMLTNVTDRQKEMIQEGKLKVCKCGIGEYLGRSSDGWSMTKVIREEAKSLIATHGKDKVDAARLHKATRNTCMQDFGVRVAYNTVDAILSQLKNGKKKKKGSKAMQTAVNQAKAVAGTSAALQSILDAISTAVKPAEKPQEESVPDADSTKIKAVAKARGKGIDLSKGLHPAKFDYALVQILRGKHVAFSGPAGCGKTVTANMLAKHVDEMRGHTGPVLRQTFYRGMESDDIWGRTGLRPNNGVMETFEADSPARTAAVEGRTFVGDEFNALTGDILYSTYPLFEGGGSIVVTPSGNTIIVHKDTIVIGTTNDMTGDKTQYAGLQEVNEALRDRFTGGIIDVDYMKPSREASWLTHETGIETNIANKISQFAKLLRVAAKDGKHFEGDISHRCTLSIAEDVVLGVSMKDTLRYKVTNRIAQHHRKAVTEAANGACLI